MKFLKCFRRGDNTGTSQILVGDITVDIVRKKIKNMYISILPPKGRVRVNAPNRISDSTIQNFIISKIKWIQKHRKKFSEMEYREPVKYVSGEQHFFKGKAYTLNVITDSSISVSSLRDEEYIDLFIRGRNFKSKREKKLYEWYRKKMKEEVPFLIKKWEHIIGVSVNSWGVRRMKTRWGTCNISDRRILLNLELIKRPTYCLEYIIVHEITHLLERKHNKKFKTYMDTFIPEWRIYNKELKIDNF